MLNKADILTHFCVFNHLGANPKLKVHFASPAAWGTVFFENPVELPDQ